MKLKVANSASGRVVVIPFDVADQQGIEVGDFVAVRKVAPPPPPPETPNPFMEDPE